MKNKNKGKPKVFRPKKAINRRNKLEITFDADARKDFLTGFSKRKTARKKAAQEQMAAEMKAEKKRIKDEARNLHKTMMVSHRPIPEVEELLGKEETYDFEQHSVSIKELSTASMADENFWIGENRTTYEDKEEEEEKTDGTSAGDNPKKGTPKSGKDVKKAVKKMATKQVQKSKVFQRKGKMEQRRQQKRSRVVNKNKMESKSAKSAKGKQKGPRRPRR